MTDAKGLIIASLVGTGAILTWRGVTHGSLTPRTYAALIVIALILIMLGSFAPDLAAAFGVFIFLAVLLSSSADLESLGRIATVRKGK